ncbi:MAG: NAD-dependent epimerase/dehydratase family protein [Fimbriimonadaceae bacterium]
MRVAVLGANGFIGTRLMERLLLGGTCQARALIRRPSALARLARFPAVDFRITDALNPERLAADLAGCDALIHAMVGDERQIVAAASVAAKACASVGARLVYLSSASVHGQNPPAGTNETSPVSDKQPVAYNNAKVRAERALARSGHRDLAILRPGIVYGPRSQWTEGLRAALRSGTAYLVNGGTGICNHVYVDNLIHAILLCLNHPRASEGPFYIADTEALSWRDFYQPFVEGWGYSMEEVWDVPPAQAPRPGLRERTMRMRTGSLGRALLPKLPRSLKDAVRAIVEASGKARSEADGFSLPTDAPPVADYETSQLHCCRTRLPMQRAPTVLGYQPLVSFEEAVQRTLCPWPSSGLSHL